MKKYLFIGTCLSWWCLIGHAEEKAPKVEFGLYVDTYFAYDFNQPPTRERLYTTLPTRHNEFAVNLAYVEGKVTADRLRGRLALQTGTSVFSNYFNEYRDAAVTRPQLADILQHLQEAVAGYRIAEGLWIDAGIFLSHIGMESFVSRDNWTYTRSLIADFSPYYQAGVRMSYDPNPTWTFQLHLLNGWQNLIETNGDKAVGTQVSYHPSDAFSITHNALIGKETELRIFQDLFFKYQLLKIWDTGIAFDFGLQRRPVGSDFAHWLGASWQNRVQLSERTRVGLRLEMYLDNDGIIVPTATPGNFQVWGGSVNLDHELLPQLLWRNELRYLQSVDRIFPGATGNSNNSVFAVSSFALSL